MTLRPWTKVASHPVPFLEPPGLALSPNFSCCVRQGAAVSRRLSANIHLVYVGTPVESLPWEILLESLWPQGPLL